MGAQVCDSSLRFFFFLVGMWEWWSNSVGLGDERQSVTVIGGSFVNRFDFVESSERKRAAAMLAAGSLFGFLGFFFAFLIGLWKFVSPEASEYHRVFPSGRGYFPETVSEMVHNSDDPAGKSFFAFEFIAALLIFMSWYPHHLRNVYLGDDFMIPFIGVSWTLFRQFVPALGMMLVATVTTTPLADATVLDMFTIGIHLFGAIMLFGGYIVFEGLTLGWGCLSGWRPAHVVGTISDPEWRARSLCLTGVIFNYSLFLTIQVILVLPNNIQTPDLWEIEQNFEENGAVTQATVLVDTAHGLFLALKITSYMSEVGCGLCLICSLMLIWAYCTEKDIDLVETLSQARQEQQPTIELQHVRRSTYQLDANVPTVLETMERRSDGATILQQTRVAQENKS